MVEKLTIEEIELILFAMGYLYSELPEYDSVCNKLVIMLDAAYEAEKTKNAISTRN